MRWSRPVFTMIGLIFVALFIGTPSLAATRHVNSSGVTTAAERPDPLPVFD
jgi:hypothetical protein